MKKGLLIVFTGIDGSGKTTQSKLLLKSLQKDGTDVSYVWSRWEPLFLKPFINRWRRTAKDLAKSNGGSDKVKDKKRKLLSNPVFRWIWLVSFLIDYGLQILVKIRINLLKKQTIISDRIFYDSIIDQAVNLGDRKDWLLGSLDSSWLRLLFPEPDIVIYVDCPEDIAFSRKDDAPDIEYLADRRKLYLTLADKYKWFKIDGTLSVDDIAVQIKDKVYKNLRLKKCQRL